MENLLKKEYLHLGTDHIYKELWQNIQMDQIYPLSKPYGGIWASHTRFDDNRICDWIDYLADDDYELERLKYQKSCLIKFKENIRFLQVNDSNDFKNLKEYADSNKSIPEDIFSTLLNNFGVVSSEYGVIKTYEVKIKFKI